MDMGTNMGTATAKTLPRRRRRNASRIISRSLPGIATALIIGVACIWLAVSTSVAGVTRKRQPHVATSVAPYDVDANAQLALHLLQREQSGQKLNLAQELARRALLREPGSALAARTLGLVSGLLGDEARARALFKYAERRSRRDLPTQVWLIEEAVRRDDIPGALSHFDIALRSSSSAESLLFPILASAVLKPEIASPFAQILSRRPLWLTPFLAYMADHGKPLDQVSAFTFRWLDPKDPIDSEILDHLSNRAVAERQYGVAWRAYELGHFGAKIHGVRNGDFSETTAATFFDWRTRNEADLGAYYEARSGAPDDQALYMTAASGRRGEVASQLLMLNEGAHDFAALIGNVTGDKEGPWISLSCANNDRIFAELGVPQADSQGRQMRQRFSVPRNCPAQWLKINASSEEQAEPAWIDKLVIRRAEQHS